MSRDKAIVFVTGEGISYSCLLRLIESIKASLKPSKRGTNLKQTDLTVTFDRFMSYCL